MDKQLATDKKEKPSIEGYLFYLLLFSVIVVLPVSSAIWLLSVA